MRSPHSLGLPERFAEWRPHQKDAVLEVASSGDGYDGLNMPTGSGKSAVYMSIASLLEGRTVILTSTKGLQDQLKREFPYSFDIRGQSNYMCNLEHPLKVTADQAICHLGVPCHLKARGCDYFAAYRKAIRSRTVVTNYSYWLSIHEYAEGLGGFDTMICDEAHNALDELGSHLSVRITDWEKDAFLDRRASPGEDPEMWGEWAESQLRSLEPKLAVELEDLKRRGSNRSLMRRIHELKRIVKKLKSVVEIGTSAHPWVFETDRGSLSWTPVWPGRSHWALFRGIRKVILVSATVTPKSLELLGLSDTRFTEYPSTFPVRNRPVIHLRSGVRLKHDTDRAGLRAWVAKMDQLIKFRLDRKGIIHTVSYKRRDYIMEHSQYRAYMVTHDRRNTRAKVEEFKRMKAPAILVSPSLDTGWDFPYDQCEYQVIAKIPFPDSRSPVYSARQRDDKDYGQFVAMVTLVQAAGRGVRAPDDRCQTFIVDDQADWFVRKNRRFAPKWFMDAYEPNVVVTPPPLPKL